MDQGAADIPQWCADVIDDFHEPEAWSPGRIAALAVRLADSGVMKKRDDRAVDVASTGGPASLSTFIPPLLLASSGSRVPKIGVPGRPAGVIDTFGVVPGYKTSLGEREFENAIASSGFGNTLSTNVFAPDDSILFRARQIVGAQQSPPLVIASLLCKKLAGGVSKVVFDVRKMNGGNFGNTAQQAIKNMDLLGQTAKALDIEAMCVASDGEIPSQPALGRSEALEGLLSILELRATSWLESHYEACFHLAQCVRPELTAGTTDREAVLQTLDAHLRAQGAEGLQALREYLEYTRTSHFTLELKSHEDGFVCWNMVALRGVLVANQHLTERCPVGEFPDAAGILLLREAGSYVRAGESVARVRGESPSVARAVLVGANLAFGVVEASFGEAKEKK